ncbi:MAG: CHAT domain-containing protein, partial [Bacteroidota bacterium]|nr:CHAT domain-containing protein [Bacteroidota bacterium]
LEHSLQIFSSRYPEKKSVIGSLYHLLGNVYKQTGDLTKALAYSQQGILLLEQSLGEQYPELGFMYELLGGIYLEQKNYSDALKFYRKAITSREQISTISRNDIASLYSSIGEVFIEQRMADSATTYLQKADVLQLQSVEINIPQRALLAKRFGDLCTLEKKYSKALPWYHNAVCMLSNAEENNVTVLPNTQNSLYKNDLVDVVTLKAQTFERIYQKSKKIDDLRAALAHYLRAADLVDDVRKQYSADGSKFHLAEKSKLIYGNACRTALALYAATKDERYNEQAFLIADRSKANILLEKLFDGEAKHFANIPDSLLQKEKDLLKDIASSETQLYKLNENSSDAARRLQAQLFTLKIQHQQLVELFERQYPKYYELKYARYSLSLKDIQHRLEPNSVLVEYLVDQNTVYTFCVSRDQLLVKTLKQRADLNDAIDRFSSSLKKYDTQNYLSSGYNLYMALLQPWKNVLHMHTKIIVIPDGNLYYVPFEALPTQLYTQASASDFSKLQYVISQNEISYSYSAEFYLKMNSAKPAMMTESFVGFAPVFKDSTKNGEFLANRSYVEKSGLSDVRSITLDGKKFNELKYSENEITSISGSFASHHMPSKSFLFTDATETNFKKYCKSYDIVHVATHGFINEKNPKFSAILFSQPQSPTADDDGILYVDETFTLDLKAQLVVLSSCESGVGKLVQGEGMIALTRGLFYAGAKNIMFSLWKVSDKQTYLLMDEFYKQLLSNHSYSSSLREAKLKMIASKESAFPSKWSGFVLVGE